MATTATREQWLAARKELLELEKELTRRSDELVLLRRELPRVRVDEHYAFETDEGTKTLAELFDGRSQLVVYHFMHGPNTPDGCVGCTFASDSFNGVEPHLNAHDVTFVLASRSPLQTLNAYKQRMGWSIPWVSCGACDFNRDFSAWTEEDRANGTGYNFGTPKSAGVDTTHDMELGAQRLRARGRHRLPHVHVLRPRHRRPQRRLAAARSHAEGPRARRGRRMAAAPPRVRGHRANVRTVR